MILRKLRHLWYRILGEQLLIDGVVARFCRQHYAIGSTFARYDDRTMYRITKHLPDRLVQDPGIVYSDGDSGPSWSMLYSVWGRPLYRKEQLTEEELRYWKDD